MLKSIVKAQLLCVNFMGPTTLSCGSQCEQLHSSTTLQIESFQLYSDFHFYEAPVVAPCPLNFIPVILIKVDLTVFAH
jgi:hypothetical protein